jgi:hypothetical protein
MTSQIILLNIFECFCRYYEGQLGGLTEVDADVPDSNVDRKSVTEEAAEVRRFRNFY